MHASLVATFKIVSWQKMMYDAFNETENGGKDGYISKEAMQELSERFNLAVDLSTIEEYSRDGRVSFEEVRVVAFSEV